MDFIFVDVEHEDSFHTLRFNKKYEIVLNSNDTKCSGIFVGLPRSLFFAKKIDLPPLSYENVQEALTYKVPKIFYFIKKPFFLFYPLKKDFSKVIILVCEKSKIDNLLNNIEKQFNSKVVGVFITSMAISDYLTENYRDFSFILERDNGYEVIVFKEEILKEFYFIENKENITNINISEQNKFIFSFKNKEESNIYINSDILSHIYFVLKSKRSSFWFKNIFPERIKFLKQENTLHKYILSFFVLSCMFILISPLIKLYLEVDILEKELQSLYPRVKKVKRMDSYVEQKLKETDNILKYFKTRNLDIFYEVSKNMPYDVDITRIDLNRGIFRCRGYYKKAADIVNSLNKLNIFKYVKLVGPILKTKRNGIEVETFDIEAKIVENR